MEPLFTRAEVAKLLRKPESWMRYQERKKMIPFIKVGQQIRYKLDDVMAWVERRRVTA